MFGITVEGHPNLRRILTHEAFQGHPLRKDYDPARRWILTEDQIYKPHFDLPQGGEDEMFERMTVNIGPSHPAMHGTFRLMAVLGRRDHRRLRRRDRLPAPLLREDVGDPHLAARHPLHRPAQLLLVVHQQRRLLQDGGEAAGRRGAAQGGVGAHHPLRVLPHHGPLRVQRHDAGGRRRSHQLLVPVPAARGDLRSPGIRAAAPASRCRPAASAV